MSDCTLRLGVHLEYTVVYLMSDCMVSICRALAMLRNRRGWMGVFLYLN